MQGEQINSLGGTNRVKGSEAGRASKQLPTRKEKCQGALHSNILLVIYLHLSTGPSKFTFDLENWRSQGAHCLVVEELFSFIDMLPLS